MQTTLTEANVFDYLRDRYPPAAGRDGAAGSCAPAGDGNINWVRRVRAGGRSFVVKQAGPALEKFPEYAVSPERILHEARYYRAVAPFDEAGICPAVHFVDPESHVMVLEDLGEAERLDAALRRGADATEALCRIARFLGRVHAGTRDPEALAPFPDPASDDGVLRLHLEHIFRLPFEANDFPLSIALRAEAERLSADAAFRGRVAAVESASRRCVALIHGDVQPTNVLLASRGAVLLDAEIAHGGAPSFDLGLLLGHIVLACAAAGRAADAAERVAPIWRAYVEAHAGAAPCRFCEVAAVAGVEMLRRTLGAARVPEVSDDAVAREGVRVGESLVREPPEEPSALRRLGR